jgi:hypothetical protein
VESWKLAVVVRVVSARAAEARAARARRPIEQRGQAWPPIIVSSRCPRSGFDGGGAAGGDVGQLVR